MEAEGLPESTDRVPLPHSASPQEKEKEIDEEGFLQTPQEKDKGIEDGELPQIEIEEERVPQEKDRGREEGGLPQTEIEEEEGVPQEKDRGIEEGAIPQTETEEGVPQEKDRGIEEGAIPQTETEEGVPEKDRGIEEGALPPTEIEEGLDRGIEEGALSQTEIEEERLDRGIEEGAFPQTENAASPQETQENAASLQETQEKDREKAEMSLEIEEETESSLGNPIEQVRLAVSVMDDPTLPALTIRTWIIGIISCIILAFANQFFAYRQNQLSVGAITIQILSLPLGRLMAATFPGKEIRVPLTNRSFSLNPGPFNVKEHVLITIFANCGAGGVYALRILTVVKAFTGREFHPLTALLLIQTTQMLGFGWAGIFRKYLVDSPYMWWPSNLVRVSLFRALHEKDKREKGGLTRLQFFAVVFVSSFAYYVVPGYLFPSISSLSFICWIWKDSVTAQQIGSGLEGFGIGSFGVDWAIFAGFLGSPLATPTFAIANTLAGFIAVLYVIVPTAYWFNAFDAKKFPIFSSHTFDSEGQTYNITRIVREETPDINLTAYGACSQVYLSVTFAFTYGLCFATLAAALSHVALFDGKTIWKLWRRTRGGVKDEFTDIHTRTMKTNYEVVPQWWFIVILIVSVVLALLTVEGFGQQILLPWWGLFLACGIACFFTLPMGIIQATTNVQMGINVITELIIGYIYPGNPVRSVVFKAYGSISMSQALSFTQDFKLGHYMKVAPKTMLLVQLVGTLVSSTTYFGTAWWLRASVDNFCRPELLKAGSPWTCPGDDVYYHTSIIWGVIGPARMFGKLGVYPQMNWFFLIGLLGPVPVWYLSRKFPEKKWIRLIHVPVIFGATSYLPQAAAVHYWMWSAVGLFFNFYIYRKHKGWWAKHTYSLSAALDAGVVFMGVFLFLALEVHNIYGPECWGQESGDKRPLAKCPTQPGIKVEGCPVVL